MFSIELEKIRFRAYHGVLEQERMVGNDFLVDLTIDVDDDKAFFSDDVADTISYVDLYDIIKSEMEIPSNLLEHLCYRIATKIKSYDTRISRVLVRVAKANPPMGADINCSAVKIEI